MQIGILGDGAVARALEGLFARLGHSVIRTNRTSFFRAVEAELVVIAIPYLACAEVLPPFASGLAGKVVVDATNPLNPNWTPAAVKGSAAEEIQALLPESRIVKAFNTVFADVMQTGETVRGGSRLSAFVAGDDASAVDQVAALARDAGFDPVKTGGLLTARYLEAMAHLNIAIAVGQGGGTQAAFIYQRG